MVTFNTQYWAPGLDVKVRRRFEATSEEEDISPASRSPAEQNSNLHASAFSPNQLDQRNSRDRVISPPNSSGATSQPPVVSRRRSLVQKLFHSDEREKTHPIPHNLEDEADANAIILLEKDKEESGEVRRILHHILAPIVRSPSATYTTYTSATSEATFALGEDKSRNVKMYGVTGKGIGKGATSVVRMVHKSEGGDSMDRVYAIKEFRKRRRSESKKDYIKKLTSEFCISSSLHHENVVEMIDLVRDDHDNWCEVMEFCSGGDLYSAIKSGQMGTSEIDCCFKQLISGIAYLHSMGVAHRDIKPENLLFSNNLLKITDFGVADVFRSCWENKVNLSRGLCGSEPYIAPEAFKGGEYDARKVDVWACGIVYFCMYFKNLPWRVATQEDANYLRYTRDFTGRTYEPFEKLESGNRALLYQMLHPDPEKRIESAKILENEWFKSIEVCSTERGKNRAHLHHYPERRSSR
ncbi:uncharacterized protein VTP21DRAFT_10115 [Calcarisporiella thermophila]|uniref:uncharacterized protein n=1 Tax=Calcarisporiella thermophila TaxID=911321 RepID=UPI0037437F5B